MGTSDGGFPLNLGLSIVLGHFFGLNGILAGVMISLLVIVCGWKPYLYHNGFKESVWGVCEAILKICGDTCVTLCVLFQDLMRFLHVFRKHLLGLECLWVKIYFPIRVAKCVGVVPDRRLRHKFVLNESVV